MIFIPLILFLASCSTTQELMPPPSFSLHSKSSEPLPAQPLTEITEWSDSTLRLSSLEAMQKIDYFCIAKAETQLNLSPITCKKAGVSFYKSCELQFQKNDTKREDHCLNLALHKIKNMDVR